MKVYITQKGILSLQKEQVPLRRSHTVTAGFSVHLQYSIRFRVKYKESVFCSSIVLIKRKKVKCGINMGSPFWMLQWPIKDPSPFGPRTLYQQDLHF